MKFNLFLLLIGAASSIKLHQKEPWDAASLPACPDDKTRTIMDDQKTHVSRYPNVGATCVA